MKDESPDFFALQETKCDSIPKEMDIKGYHHYLESPADKSGYAGVLILTKEPPTKVAYHFLQLMGFKRLKGFNMLLVVVTYGSLRHPVENVKGFYPSLII